MTITHPSTEERGWPAQQSEDSTDIRNVLTLYTTISSWRYVLQNIIYYYDCNGILDPGFLSRGSVSHVKCGAPHTPGPFSSELSCFEKLKSDLHFHPGGEVLQRLRTKLRILPPGAPYSINESIGAFQKLFEKLFAREM